MASGSVIREIQPGEGALVADVLHELRPHRRWLGELSGVELVDILTQSRSGGTTGEAARD